MYIALQVLYQQWIVVEFIFTETGIYRNKQNNSVICPLHYNHQNTELALEINLLLFQNTDPKFLLSRFFLGYSSTEKINLLILCFATHNAPVFLCPLRMPEERNFLHASHWANDNGGYWMCWQNMNPKPSSVSTTHDFISDRIPKSSSCWGSNKDTFRRCPLLFPGHLIMNTFFQVG